jgi:5-methylcytosine-specific restriction enzyme subunit McrC
LRRLKLLEYKTERDVALTIAQREAIRELHPGILIQPSRLSTDRYDITPDHRIGLIATSDLVLEIRPKIPMNSVLFLLGYSCDAAAWSEEQPAYAEGDDFTELLAVMLARMVERATRRGLLHGYRTEEEALQSPRGQILFQEQLRRRFNVAPPVEVTHDVFTPDILENRLLRAGVALLSRLPLASTLAQRELSRAQGLFGGVNRIHYSGRDVPDVVLTRLNRHYHPALALSTLVLRSGSLDLGGGGPRGSALLVDMNSVFEEFVRKALRNTLKLDTSTFPDRPPPLRLDLAGRIPLKPDLCVVEDGRIRWIGDAKYKRLPSGMYANADIYQLLAYCIASGLPGGTLIYAADEGIGSAEHVAAAGGQRLAIVALDLTAPRSALLRQVDVIADSVRAELARPPATNLQQRSGPGREL